LVLDRTEINSNGSWPSLGADDLLAMGTFNALGIEVSNGISLASGRIGGHLRLDGAHLRGGDNAALAANGLRVTGSVELGLHGSERFTADGAVELEGAKIDASLRLNGASLKAPKGDALSAMFLTVGEIIDGSPRGGHRLEALGTLRIQNGRAGAVYLNGAQLTGQGGVALAASGLETSGDLFATTIGPLPFMADGSVELIDAQIGGQLAFSGATLKAHDADVPAFAGDSLRVHRGGFFDALFTVEGETRMLSAEFGAPLYFSGARLSNPGGRALAASGLVVKGDAFFQADTDGDPFVADGQIEMSGCVISGQLGFDGAQLSGPLILEEAQVTSLWIRFGEEPEALVLLQANIGALYNWSHQRGLSSCATELRNGHYDTLSSASRASTQEHLRWLQRDPSGYSPQPYEALAAAFVRAGHEDEARAVLVAKEQRRRSVLSWRGKIGSYLLGATVAHGYRSSQAAVWLGALLIVGACLFGTVFDAGPAGHHYDLTPARDAKQVPSFQPVIYSLDVLLPVIDLGQATAWNAHGASLWVSVGLALSGWLLTAALVAGIAAKRR
jgi:hypothetical protein